jgi:glycine dehydrogenase subunit 2
MRSAYPLLIEKSRPGRRGITLPESDVPVVDLASEFGGMLRSEAPALPEVAEVDVVRHYTGLSRRAHGVDSGFYPLGSCTMKYNPKLNEDVARLQGFTQIHPLQPQESAQGCLEVLHHLQNQLAEITGMDAVSLQPAAGAHGEWTGVSLIKAYHQARGDVRRTKMLIPDSAHGTNPASAAMAGFEVVEVPSAADGGVDVEALKNLMNDEVAGLMLTNPNTLGLFDRRIGEVAETVHASGGLLYYDGANLNAIMGITRPGDMGFDVVHLNLHKTFSTPHGGGGPGSGPVGCKAALAPYLPGPLSLLSSDGSYRLEETGEREDSIGRVKNFYGNFGVMLKAYTYILSLGAEGLREASELAVLNANYMMAALKKSFDLPYERTCMHEFVLSGEGLKRDTGVSTMDVAKNLLDRGVHPPTVYFPLIVHEAMMFEPTETESRETLDEVIAMMEELAREARDGKHDTLAQAPLHTPVGRLDEVGAARKPKIHW